MLVAITNIIQICSGRNSRKDNQEKNTIPFFSKKKQNYQKNTMKETPLKKCPCLDGGRTMNQIFFSYQMNQA